jgi:hypothetical protein
MPRDSVHVLQLLLFASDPVSSPEALARYEALRPVLTGQRSLRQWPGVAATGPTGRNA